MIAFYVSLGAILGVCAVVLILQWRALGQRRIIGRRLDRYTLTDKGYRSVMGGHEPDRWDE